MNKFELHKYINKRYTHKELSLHFKISESTIRYWLKKYKIKSKNKRKPRVSNKSAKQTKKIKKLFENENLGARKIAERLGIKHSATVSKKLIIMGLRRKNTCIEERSKLNIKFKRIKSKLSLAAEHELIKLCLLSNFDFAVPSSDAPYDLLVDFGDGLKKIQVKSSYYQASNKRGYVFKIDKTRNNSTSSRKIKYKENEVDYFFLHDIEGNSWLIPFKFLKEMGAISPMLRYPGYQIT